MVQNLPETKKAEFKKSFELYRQISLKVSMKVCLNFGNQMPFSTIVNTFQNILFSQSLSIGRWLIDSHPLQQTRQQLMFLSNHRSKYTHTESLVEIKYQHDINT